MLMLRCGFGRFLGITLILSFVSFSTLSAFSIGRSGAAYEEDGILWQPVRYEDRDGGYVADIPGRPVSGLRGDILFIASEYEDSTFIIFHSAWERFIPAASEAEFIKELKAVLQKNQKLKAITVDDPEVYYAVEIVRSDRRSKALLDVRRVYQTSNQLYFALVEGEDYALAQEFFSRIRFVGR